MNIMRRSFRCADLNEILDERSGKTVAFQKEWLQQLVHAVWHWESGSHDDDFEPP
jgi:hypothetical protein